MADKIYFAFFRDFDEYPLSEGFYNSDILNVIKKEDFCFFHHPDENEMQEYTITDLRTGCYEGYIILTAFSINTSVYCKMFDKDFIKHQEFYRDCSNFFDTCMNNTKNNLHYLLLKQGELTQ
jgi:hypothetical protein